MGSSRKRGRARGAVAHDRAQLLVAVADEVGLHHDGVAEAPLDRPAAAVDGRAGRPRSGCAAAECVAWGRAQAALSVAFPDAPPLHTTRPDRSRGAPACSCTWPRCPAGASGPRPTRSSTGWRRPGSRGGRCCRSTPPDGHGSPYASPSAFAGWPGLLAHPGAAVSARRAGRLPRAQRATGSTTGSASPGPDALADQVRFDREWSALRAYAADRGVRIMGDIPIYVAPGARRRRAPTRSSSAPTSSPACRRTPSPTTASCGATRSTTGTRWRATASAGGSSGCAAAPTLHDCLRIDHFRAFEA